MEEEDFIFEEKWPDEEDEETLQGDLAEGDKVIINGENFIISEFIKAKKVTNNLGFDCIYSWYRAKTEDEETNLFFFDDDLDCQEDNDKVAEEWFNSYGGYQA